MPGTTEDNDHTYGCPNLPLCIYHFKSSSSFLLSQIPSLVLDNPELARSREGTASPCRHGRKGDRSPLGMDLKPRSLGSQTY